MICGVLEREELRNTARDRQSPITFLMSYGALHKKSISRRYVELAEPAQLNIW